MDLDMKGGVPSMAIGVLGLSFKTMLLGKLKDLCPNYLFTKWG